jgi:hypothetical protein
LPMPPRAWAGMPMPPRSWAGMPMPRRYELDSAGTGYRE